MTFDFTTLITDRTEADVLYLASLMAKGEAAWTDEERDFFFNGPSDLLPVWTAENSVFLSDGAQVVIRKYYGGGRGAYTARDLNRVTACMEYLTARLNANGYSPEFRPVEIVPGRTVWDRNDEQTAEQMAAYLANVRALRDALGPVAGMPAGPARMTPSKSDSADGLNFEGANDIERIMLRLRDLLESLERSHVPAGEALSGGDYL